MPPRSLRHASLLSPALLALSLAGCRYDLDQIYKHGGPSDGGPGDAQAQAEAAVELPKNLIDLWRGQSWVSEACVACAKRECKEQNTACLADADCGALTACAATSTDPNTLADCRAQHIEWLSEKPVDRALAGPYYACVFRDGCSDACETHTEWGCLDDYSWRRTSSSSVPIRLRFADALTAEPAAGVTVKVCRAEDLACAKPSSALVADADGVVQLDLPTPLRAFVGYLELTGNGWYPTLVHFGWPLARSSVVPLPIINQQGVEQNVISAGVDPDPTRGLLQLRMFGCAGVGMRGVSFKADKADLGSRTWYANPLPSFQATETGDFGNGGIINVPAGLNEVTATRTSDNKVVARTSVPVRAGFITVVLLAPLDSSQ